MPVHRLHLDHRGRPRRRVAGTPRRPTSPRSAHAVGARIARTDGVEKVIGAERFGDDLDHTGVLLLRAVRSPHDHARFTVGDLGPLHARHPGLVRVLAAADVPGQNLFGIYATGKDQPVLADGLVRFQGEAVLALVGDPETVLAIDDDEVPIAWEPLPALIGVDAGARSGRARASTRPRPGNILVEGVVRLADADAALAASAVTASGTFETTYVEHAYIEPEAGTARIVDGRVEVFATTQTPYMDRDELALILGLPEDRVRVIPSACGGGFGGKLDLSLQPLIAMAALLLDRPVRALYPRPESMASTTKRHPARISATFGAGADGRLTGVSVHADFDTGAYASWGPTVANRVPVHATGPVRRAAVVSTGRAIYTNGTPSGPSAASGSPRSRSPTRR